MIIDNAFNPDHLIEFPDAPIKGADKKKVKVFLIFGNWRAHLSTLVKMWESEHAEQIELIICPAIVQN